MNLKHDVGDLGEYPNGQIFLNEILYGVNTVFFQLNLRDNLLLLEANLLKANLNERFISFLSF